MDWKTENRSKRQLALTYLHTMGAKALILADKGQERDIVFNSLDEELAAKQEMLLEEKTKTFKRDMHIHPGILVTKRGRNGTERDVYIRYVKSNTNVLGFGITWNSTRLGRVKYFDLSSLRKVEVGSESPFVDYVQLENQDRKLQLKFQAHDMPAFLHHAKSLSYR